MHIAVLIVLMLLTAAAAWDFFVWRRWGIDSGKTISWQLYQDSRNWPALAFLIGYGAHWLTSGGEVMFLFAAVLGHIFGQMRGVT